MKVKGCLLLRFFFLFYVFFLNIVLTWKFVGASKVSVLYIYIDEEEGKRGKFKKFTYK